MAHVNLGKVAWNFYRDIEVRHASSQALKKKKKGVRA